MCLEALEVRLVPSLTGVDLGTLADVPWNAPFYARLGFRIVEPDALTPGLIALLEYEARRGLPARLRLVMRYAIAP